MVPTFCTVIALYLTSGSVVASSIIENKFERKLDFIPTGNPYQSLSVRSNMQCASICASDHNCSTSAVNDAGSGFVDCDLYGFFEAEWTSIQPGVKSYKQIGMCPINLPGIYHRNDVCYKVITSSTSWDQARLECLSLTPSAYLAVVNTPQKLADVMDIATDAGLTRFWTAARRVSGTSHYAWSDSGTIIPSTFFTWGDGEPDQRVDEDFLMLDRHYQTSWAWHDNLEGWSLDFICEL